MTVVRAAEPADGQAIAEVQLAAWRSTYGELNPGLIAGLDLERTAANWARAAEDPKQRIRLACADDGSLLGYAMGGPSDHDAALGELHAIYLLPETQGRGVGRLLAQDTLDGLWRRGFRECILWVVRDNPGARGFYEHLGFTADGATEVWRGLATVRYRIRLAHGR